MAELGTAPVFIFSYNASTGSGTEASANAKNQPINVLNVIDFYLQNRKNDNYSSTVNNQGSYNPTTTSAFPVAANTTNPSSAAVSAGMYWIASANGTMNGIAV